MTFLYKCRACGKIDRNPSVGGDDKSSQTLAIQYLLKAIRYEPTESMSPAMLGVHCCGEKRTGISDLIGCAPDDEKTYRNES